MTATAGFWLSRGHAGRLLAPRCPSFRGAVLSLHEATEHRVGDEQAPGAQRDAVGRSSYEQAVGQQAAGLGEGFFESHSEAVREAALGEALAGAKVKEDELAGRAACFEQLFAGHRDAVRERASEIGFGVLL